MRVISGNARGTRLNSLKGENTRPTLDRVKEALFSIIQFNIKDSNVLDLFSGSGALGIEGLSRGAKKTIFCDNSFDAIKVIKQNLIKTRFEDKSEIINKDYIKALEEIKIKFDIIFLDPPYKTDYIIKALIKIFELDLLTKDGIIIIETNDKSKEEEIKEKFADKKIEIYDTRKYGIVNLIFIRKG